MGPPLKTLVYNRDFVEKNFNQPDELKGIFTLGEKDKTTLEQIGIAKAALDLIEGDIIKLKNTLGETDNNSGKMGELKQLEEDFTEKCWKLKNKHDKQFLKAFTGYRGSRQDFKEKLIKESMTNSATSVSLDELGTKATTIFGDTPQNEELLVIPDWKNLLIHETNPVLKKKVIGKSDVDIAAMIKKLNNSDWVKEGRKFYDPEERICPFCQQETTLSLENSLNEYFDETFEADTTAIDKLYSDYKSSSEGLLQVLQKHVTNPSKFLDDDKLKIEKELLESNINTNIRYIAEKAQEPSKPIELNPSTNNLDAIKVLLDIANSKIQEHNDIVNNLQIEKSVLTQQVWRYLIDNEIKEDLNAYNTNKNNLDKAINNLNNQIDKKNEDKSIKEQEIKILEKDTTSIQPTIHDINGFLKSFGFQGFVLAKSERERRGGPIYLNNFFHFLSGSTAPVMLPPAKAAS